jgi:phosphatidylserine decarboxylase
LFSRRPDFVLPNNMVKEAYKFAVPPLVVGMACLFLGWKWAAGILVFLGLFVFYFFRDPERRISPEPHAVVSPADGHVVEIVDEPFDSREGHRISIFLSIWDVHVQRAPVAGRITSVIYRPGLFYAALRSAASRENEQNIISIETEGGVLVFKQIAGAIARRVLCWKSVGEIVALGERVGLIRFGSRVDVWLPMDAQVVVRRGQKVKGGSSILAKWNSTA